MATKWYKVHGGKLTFREYWKMSPDPFTFAIMAGLKLFGGPPMKFSVPRIDKLPYVELDDLPGGPRRTIKRGIGEFEEAGFDLQFLYEVPSLERDRFGSAAVLLAQDRRSFATVLFAEAQDMSQMAYNCVCWFGEDRFGNATTQKEQLKPDPRHITVRFPGASPEELADRHKGLMADWQDDGEQIVKVTPETLPELILGAEQGHVDFHAERGVYVPMSKEEVRKNRGEDD